MRIIYRQWMTKDSIYSLSLFEDEEVGCFKIRIADKSFFLSPDIEISYEYLEAFHNRIGEALVAMRQEKDDR